MQKPITLIPKSPKFRKNLTNIRQNQHQIPATQKTSPKSPQKSTHNIRQNSKQNQTPKPTQKIHQTSLK